MWLFNCSSRFQYQNVRWSWKSGLWWLSQKNEVGVLGAGRHREGGWPESREQDGGYPSLSIIIYWSNIMISVILKRLSCTTSPPVLMMSSRWKEARLVGGTFVILIIILSSLHCHHHHHPPSHLYTNVSILMFPMIKKASFSIPKLCQANPRQRAVPTPFFLPVTIIFDNNRLLIIKNGHYTAHRAVVRSISSY